MKTFNVVKIDCNYCDYLRKFDNRVPYNAGIKETRPFIGVVFVVNDCEYFAPLSSPKSKHINMKNNVDLIKINDGKHGVINFNNMIPVRKNNYILYDLDENTDDIYKQKWHKLIKLQLVWLNKNISLVKSKAIKLYNMYNNNTLNESIRNRCCNFKLLEEKCDQYNSVKN